MTKKQQIYRKILLKAIHVSPRYVNFYVSHRNEWEEFLWEHFGVKSSAKLNIDNLRELRAYMDFEKDSLNKINNNKITKNQLELLVSLWENYAQNKTKEALLKWIQNKFNVRYLKLEYISKKDASWIIGVLRKF